MRVLGHYITRRYLTRASARHVQDHPQLAVWSFDLITHFIHLDGQYERDQLRLLSEQVFPRLPAPGLCLDVGANIGNHTLHFARHFDSVLAFEPHPRNFALLSINAELAANVTPLNLAASDANGTAEIADDRLNLAASSIGRSVGRADRTVRFTLVRIDDLAQVQAAPRISFMKFDVEGHEAQALTGAEATIRKHRPLVMLEVLADEIDAGSAASVEVLRRFGYRHFYEPVAAGGLGRLPKPLRKIGRTLVSLLTGRHPSKAARLVPVDRLEKRSYLMLLCAMEPLTG